MTILYCDSKAHRIEDENGNIVTVEQAKEMLFKLEVNDCNLSFKRLASLDFDWDKLDKFYQENP